ncbi:filamentous hemagglutinin N-terminal domain-containing protein [Calothrix sp. CCY 0018]|uniref:two-partner secretion domain-containing protein n=1 Tax=Calothrix sp. CCY 0018 TaxID=3103864 RepID=UPI0039C63A16
MKNIECKWKLYSLILLGSIGVGITSIKPCFAQTNIDIVPDNTLGTEASRINNNINVNDIPSTLIEGGAERGQNLFHSLQELNVSEGRGAYFIVPNDAIQNVLTRVTGNNLSEILGTLGIRQRDGSNFVRNQANLFLINPNGIIFGENATLDVNGSFVGTTANAIKFGEQGFFSATNPQAPPLLTVNPDALLFNQINQNAVIQNNSVASTGIIESQGFAVFGLRVPDGKSLLLNGGNVSMNRGQLNAYGGRVELGGLAEPGTVALDINGDDFQLGFPENVTRADVWLTNRARVYVEANGGGDIAVNARNIEILSGSRLIGGIGEGLGTPEAVAGDITLDATGEINISSSSILNSVRSQAKGQGGDININTRSLSATEGARLNTGIRGEGDAGNVTVKAKDDVSLANANIFSTVERGSVGKGGNIEINTATLSLRDGARLDAGIRGEGNGGKVTINADGGTVSLDGVNGLPTAILTNVEEGAKGNSGGVSIIADSLFVTNGALVESRTRGEGKGGNLTVKAQDIQLIGRGTVFGSGLFSSAERNSTKDAGNLIIKTNTLLVQDGAEVSANTFGEGNGGNITVESGSLNLGSGAFLSASTFGKGDAGNVTVTAKDDVSLTDARIFSTVEAQGVGKSGNININAATLSLRNGAQLLTITRGAPDTQSADKEGAGNVNVNVTGVVDIAGEKNGFRSAISSDVLTGTEGNVGNITVNSGSLNLGSGAELSASTFGKGNAGDVTVNAIDAVSLTDARIFSTVGTGAEGDGGNITVESGSFNLAERTILTASTFGKGDAGNVTVKAKDAVSLTDASEIISQTLGIGNGGEIYIEAKELSLNENAALITDVAGGAEGQGGRVNLQVTGTISLKGGAPAGTGESTRITTGSQPFAQGPGGEVKIKAGSLVLTDGAIVKASTASQEDAGNIIVKADVVDISRSVPSSGLPSGLFSTTSAEGNAGSIEIDAKKQFQIKDGAALSTRTQGSGNGGSITVQTNTFNATDGGQLVTTASDRGKAGEISINADNKITISGSELNYENRIDRIRNNPQRDNPLIANSITETGADSGLYADTTGSNTGGGIMLSATNLDLNNGGKISTQSTGTGKAGNINIELSNDFNADNGQILTRSQQSSGGNIEITAGKNIFLRNNSDIRTTLSTRAGSGGDIELKANAIVALEDSDILAFAPEGSGGNIAFNTRAFLSNPLFSPTPQTSNRATLDALDGNNRVDVDASGSISAGNISGIPDISFLQNSLIELAQNTIDSEALIATSCVVRSKETNGTFYIIGSQGFPYRPGDAVPSKYSAIEVQPVPNNTSAVLPRRRWKMGDPIVEPTGVYRLANGRRILSRECGK